MEVSLVVAALVPRSVFSYIFLAKKMEPIHVWGWILQEVLTPASCLFFAQVVTAYGFNQPGVINSTGGTMVGLATRRRK
jgi:hypothetical protein